MKKLTILMLTLLMALSIGTTAFAGTSYETKVLYGVNLRTEPNTNSQIQRMLKKNEAIHVLYAENSNWLRVETQKGELGYVSAKPKYTNYVAPVVPNQTPQEKQAKAIIDYAKSLMGKVTYKYGARNPEKLQFDCSSFTQFVFKSQGIYIPWGANAQTTYGTDVKSINDLKPGDLVMASVSTPGKIGHVGIYIGEGKFIHNVNPTSNVVISDLTSGYWKNHFVKGTRVIK